MSEVTDMQTQNEIQKIRISKAQSNALNHIMGLSEKAFLLVVSEKQTADGTHYIEGTDEQFDALTSDLFEEVYYELSPPTRLKSLRTLYRRLQPESEI